MRKFYFGVENFLVANAFVGDIVWHIFFVGELKTWSTFIEKFKLLSIKIISFCVMHCFITSYRKRR